MDYSNSKCVLNLKCWTIKRFVKIVVTNRDGIISNQAKRILEFVVGLNVLVRNLKNEFYGSVSLVDIILSVLGRDMRKHTLECHFEKRICNNDLALCC